MKRFHIAYMDDPVPAVPNPNSEPSSQTGEVMAAGIPTLTNDPPPPPEGDISESGPSSVQSSSQDLGSMPVSQPLETKPEAPLPTPDLIQADTIVQSPDPVSIVDPPESVVGGPVQSEPSASLSNDFPPIDASAPQDAVTSSGDNGKRFVVFIIVLSVIAALIWAGVAYIYYSNNQLREEVVDTDTASQVEVTPVPAKPSEEIRILNGDVVRIDKITGESSVIIDKVNYAETGITGFVEVIVSPDEARMCFTAIPPAPSSVLYVSDIQGTDVAQVDDNATECVWSDDSSMIAYLNPTTDVSPVDVHVYTLLTQESLNLTEGVAGDGTVRVYDTIGWISDTLIRASYSQTEGASTTPELGESTIDILTGEVTEKEDPLQGELGETESTPSATLTPTSLPPAS